MAIDVRMLIQADVMAYWEVRLRALREEPDAYGSAYEEEREKSPEEVATLFEQRWIGGDNFIMGAFDGSLVGTVGFYRDGRRKVRHVGSIVGVYVRPEARGRGVGGALMNAAIAQARGVPDLEQLSLAVTITNTRARQLYRSLGFTAYGVEPRALKVGDRYLDEELMILRLFDR